MVQIGEKSVVHVSPPEDLAADLIWGVAGIAEAIGRTQRQAFHLLENELLPAKKVGGRWCASRSGLRQFFAILFNGDVA